MPSSFPPLTHYCRIVIEFAAAPEWLQYLNHTSQISDARLSLNHLEDETFALIKTAGGGIVNRGDDVFIEANCSNPDLFLSNQIPPQPDGLNIVEAKAAFVTTLSQSEVLSFVSQAGFTGQLNSGCKVSLVSRHSTEAGTSWYLSPARDRGKAIFSKVQPNASWLLPEVYLWNKKDLTDIAWLLRCMGVYESSAGITIVNHSRNIVRIIFQETYIYTDALYADLHPLGEIKVLGDASDAMMCLYSGSHVGNYRSDQHDCPTWDDGTVIEINEGMKFRVIS